MTPEQRSIETKLFYKLVGDENVMINNDTINKEITKSSNYFNYKYE